MTAMPPSPFISEPTTSTGGHQEAPAETSTVTVAAGSAGPFDPSGLLAEIEADHCFVLDERAFMEAIEPSPAFLSDPSPEYLQASEMIPMLAVLAGH